jgi:hypothetical protein
MDSHRELRAAIEARKELGPDHEDAVVASFLARIEGEIEARVDQRLAGRKPAATAHASPWPGFLLAITTIGILVPISEDASTASFIVAALVVVVVNLAYNLRRG